MVAFNMQVVFEVLVSSQNNVIHFFPFASFANIFFVLFDQLLIYKTFRKSGIKLPTIRFGLG